MATLPDTPPAGRPGTFGTLVTIALVLALAWVLARWTWVFLAPAPTAAAASGASGVDLAAVAKLFGGAPPAGGAAAPSASGIRLKGVVAPSPAEIGSAIFNLGGKDIAVDLGAELSPGVRLVAVEPDHAVLSRGGVRERIDLDVRMAAVPRAAAGRQPPGFRLPVSRSGPNDVAFSRGDLENALKDPGQLKYLGRIGVSPGGGVRLVEAPPGSLASRLGLQPGDVIRKVNGQPVASAGDLARLHQQFATTSLVQAEVQRGTATVRLNFTINP